MFITPMKVLSHLDRVAAWSDPQRTSNPAPVTVEWDLSNRCPLGCFACHFAHTHTKGPWVARERRLPMAYESGGDLADFALVTRGLTEMAAVGVRGMVWSGGGEPTTHPQWQEVLRHASGQGLKQGMYTAGVLIDRSGAKTLASEAEWVVVSLDAHTRESYRKEKQTDAFFRAKAGALFLADAGVKTLGISFMLHAGNWMHAEAMVALGRSLGGTYVTFRPIIDTQPDDPTMVASSREWVTKALPLLTRLHHDEHDLECDPARFEAYRDWEGRSYHTCYGIRFNTTVTPDGRVWVCVQRRGVAGSEVGDLRQESFGALWQRHRGAWTDFSGCRVMCRLHLMNQTLAQVYAPRLHTEFV